MEALWKSLCACITLNFKPFFQSSYTPHFLSPTSHFMHCHFLLVSHGYFLLSSLFSACPFAVLTSLRHLPLISRQLSSLFFCSFVHLNIHNLFPSYGLSLLFSLEWSILYVVFQMWVSKVKIPANKAAVTLRMKFLKLNCLTIMLLS